MHKGSKVRSRSRGSRNPAALMLPAGFGALALVKVLDAVVSIPGEIVNGATSGITQALTEAIVDALVVSDEEQSLAEIVAELRRVADSLESSADADFAYEMDLDAYGKARRLVVSRNVVGVE